MSIRFGCSPSVVTGCYWPKAVVVRASTVADCRLAQSSETSAQSKVSVWPSHLQNSRIKGDGVRVFLSGRDRP
jgi:hypothetical protein